MGIDPKLVDAAVRFVTAAGGLCLSATALFWSLKRLADKAAQEFQPGMFKRWIKSLTNVVSPFAVGGRPIQQGATIPPPEGVELVLLQDGSSRLVATTALSSPPPPRPPIVVTMPPLPVAEKVPKQE
jgi:hypothetical protein